MSETALTNRPAWKALQAYLFKSNQVDRYDDPYACFWLLVNWPGLNWDPFCESML